MASGSVALLGFGIDSFVESASGSVMIWRLHAERNADEDDEERIEHVERRAQKLVAGSLILLAAYIAWDSITLAHRRRAPGAIPGRHPARHRVARRSCGGWRARSGASGRPWGAEAAIKSEMLDQVIEAIEKAASTGKIGDGKIFVFELEQVVRIRTGETGTDAL